MVRQDGGKITGIGTVTKWNPIDLDRKFELEDYLKTQGFNGLALEKKALEVLDHKYDIRPTGIAVSRNTLVNGGTAIMLDALIGAVPVYYTNALATLGVGDSAAAFNATHTNLQGAVVVVDRIRKAMDATFPSRAANVVTFRATFGTVDANFQWNEWAIFNNIVDALGTMLNRAVSNLGTKTAAAAWQLTVTLTQN